jgi:hypothetical protein
MAKDFNNNYPHDKPAFSEAATFHAKATLLQINRAAYNILRNETIRFPKHDRPSDEAIIGQSVTRLWTDSDDSEKHLLAGKVHNLRLALRGLNGVEMPAGGVFSFWAQVGRPSKRRGYAAGRELREGCIIPTVGGGLCQLSNALYDAALSAGFEIVERHAHTQIVPGSLAEVGRDATVFWNYVDLRFKSSRPFRIEAMMDANLLTVRFRGGGGQDRQQVRDPAKKVIIAAASTAPQSCVTCDVHDCFRHVGHKAANFGRSAYLVDEYYPEFNSYILEARREQDLLAIPLDGKRFGKGNYAWSTEGFRHVRQSRLITMSRAYQSRKLAMQGAARQRSLLAYSERLARSYSALLEYDITHVTVSQNLLPFLWRDGHLGGRTFDVLMTAMPLARIHEILDAACALHPESKTLADFRADGWLVRAESEALQHARGIITPHSEIASLYRDKATLLDWAMPPKAKKRPPKRLATRGVKIAFPGPTVGRKGAYELRAAVQGLGVQLVTVGAQLEGADFWQGVSIEHRVGNEDWLDGVDAVVLPAFVEHKPRRLLEAVACGTPVIASTACGLENIKEVIKIPFGDVEALREEIKRVVSVTKEQV